MSLQLDASETANLWGTYISNSASVCLIKHYLQTVEDQEIKLLLNTAFNNALKSVLGATRLFQEAGHPLPYGFTDEDVDLHAPRLFSDLFFLLDIWRLSEYGMVFLRMALSTSLNKEVRSFYTELLHLNTTLMNDAAELAQAKGISPHSPRVPYPDKAEFVQKENFFKGLLGHHRSLSVLGIKEIVFSLIGMAHGEALLMGFSQAAKSADVRDYFRKSKAIFSKQTNALQSILAEEELPMISTLVDHVTSSSAPPYSDKLMMFLTMSLGQLVLGRYGFAMAQCARNDVLVHMTCLVAEYSAHAKAGLDIMLEISGSSSRRLPATAML